MSLGNRRNNTYKFDEFKHFQDGRIEEIVSAVVADESVDHWSEEVALDDVAVVELVFQSNNLPHAPECVCKKIYVQNLVGVREPDVQNMENAKIRTQL